MPRASVSGKVTLGGSAPKEQVRLNFVGVDNLPLSTVADAEGNYALAGVPVGPVKVTVTPAQPPAPEARPGRATGGESIPGRTAPRATAIPAEYQDPQRPALVFQVEAGANVIPIELRGPAR
jgi:hypothetical protein